MAQELRRATLVLRRAVTSEIQEAERVNPELHRVLANVISSTQVRAIAFPPSFRSRSAISHAATHDEHHPPRGGDVAGRIAIRADQVRIEAGGNRTNPVAEAQRRGAF